VLLCQSKLSVEVADANLHLQKSKLSFISKMDGQHRVIVHLAEKQTDKSVQARITVCMKLWQTTLPAKSADSECITGHIL